MTEVEAELPPGFAFLEPHAKIWGKLDTQLERYELRQSSSMKELKLFYDLASPRLDEIFEHLDRFPMDDLPPPEALLYRTVMAMTEVAQSVEIFNQPRVPYAPFPHEMVLEWNSHE